MEMGEGGGGRVVDGREGSAIGFVGEALDGEEGEEDKEAVGVTGAGIGVRISSMRSARVEGGEVMRAFSQTLEANLCRAM
jgi:hypothetical protein